MTVARRKGDAGLADLLFSRIIRARGCCEYPGCASGGPFDTAHLIGRRYRMTRCVEDNALCLCRAHHLMIDGWWDEKRKAVAATIGEDRYDELRRLAEGSPQMSSAMFWAGEVERLRARCTELGLDTRRRVS